MAIVRDQGIVLRQWDWSETSQTVSVFCREVGLVRGVAKGAKREKSNFSGGLELLTRGELMASVKNPDSLALLTAWDLQELFPAARATLAGFQSGMFMLDLVQHAVREMDPHPAVYDALLAGLRALGSPRGDRSAVLGVLWSVLADTGHMPELSADVRTGEPLTTAAIYAFEPRMGGLTVDRAAGGAGGGVGGEAGVWRVRAETVELLRTLRDGGDFSRFGDETVDRAIRLMALVFRDVFAVEPKSAKQYFGGEFEPRRG